MAKSSEKSDFFNMHVHEMQAQAGQALQKLLSAYPSAAQREQSGAAALGKSLEQFFSILDAIDRESDTHKAVERDDMLNLADHGLGLINELNHWAIKLECDEAQQVFTGLSIPMALWCARQHIPLNELDPVVQAVSRLANSTQDTRLLGQVSDAVEVIIDAVTPQIKQDMDKSDPDRPWRMLNLNHGIVATRTHDPRRMEAVFEQLMYRLPDDVGEFFRDGMDQLDRIGYPDHVRTVMEKYYHLTNKPTLH